MQLKLLLRVARRVLRSLRLRARVLGRIGTGDPAEPAQVFGLLLALRHAFPQVDLHELQVDWMEPAVDLEGSVRGRVWPIAILWIVASEVATTRWRSAVRRRSWR